ncbi:MAG: transposase [Flavobacteriales bacterium Tduv]
MSKPRWVVERIFGSIKRCFGSGKARYKGLYRLIHNTLWRYMAHNLYHSLALL